MKRFSALFLLLCITFLFSCGAKGPKEQPRVRAGILDCRSWDFEKNGSVKIEGAWDFYWDRILPPEEINSPFSEPQRTFINVPSVWTSKSFAHQTLPARGKATYHVKVLLPPDIHERLAIQIPAVDTAFQIYAHGQPIFSNTISNFSYLGSEPLYYAPVVREIEPAGSVDIVVTMSNLNYPRPGMRDSLSIGSRKNVLSSSENRLVSDMFLIGAIFLMVIYHFGIFFLRRSDRSSLYFSLLCIVTVIRIAVTGQGYAYRFQWCTWREGTALEYLTFYWCTAFCGMYIRSLYPEDVHKFVIRGITAASSVFTLIVLFTPILFYATTLVFFDIFAVTGIVYVTFAIARAVARKKEESGILMIGMIIFFGTVLNDILFNYRIVHTAFFMPVGLYTFFFAQSFILSRRYSRSFARAEILSHKLEQEVLDRTDKLEKERFQLEKKNGAMEKEIILAGRLQEQLIPLKSPAANISSFYKPMSGVGGDFFDFIQFRENDKIGIFVCDVSGHGVPAAFITLMLKSILLQSADRKENPAALLSYINEILFNNSGGYYCTAFYGIYNFKENTLIYSNAGHERPYIISETTISKITGATSLPVGMFDNAEIASKKKQYANGKIELPENGKLIIFTDGLSNAKNRSGSELFSERCDLPSLFLRFKNKPSALFIGDVYKSLLDFHGSDMFEDDICIVCIDT